MTRRVDVITTHVYPPIPIRTMDWQATLDGYEPGDPIGRGPTEADAVYDLFIQIDEREMEEQDDQERYQYEMGADHA